MIAAMGYVIFSDDDSHVQAGNQAVERTSTKTTASKEKNSQTTSSKVKDKETKDRTSKQLPDVKNRRLEASFGWSRSQIRKRN